MRITEKNKKAYDRTMNHFYPWADNKRIIELSNSTEFLVELFEQNLEHARHVENERLTYCGCFTALIGGGMAVLSAIGSEFFGLLLSVILATVALLSYMLNERWSNSFDRHITYAKGCYFILSCAAYLNRKGPADDDQKEEWLNELREKDILDENRFLGVFEEEVTGLDGKLGFKEAKEKENRKALKTYDDRYTESKEIFRLGDGSGDGKTIWISRLPLYCFGINNPINKWPQSKRASEKVCLYDVDKTGTKVYFTLYYRLVIALTVLVGLYYLYSVIVSLLGL